MVRLVILSALVAVASAVPHRRQLQKPSPLAPVKLATFDNAPGTTHHWEDSNDPVMGGRSTSGFTITPDKLGSTVGSFEGTCAIVPFLHAPGFCKITTMDRRSSGRLLTPFPDVSAMFTGALHIRAKTSTPSYAGYKIAFGADGATRPTPSRHGGATFKADFQLTGTDWQDVKIPFSQFSIDWSEYTGECSTLDPTGEQHHCCSAAHPEVCVTAAHLKAINTLEVWAEGVVGDFHVEIKWIGASKAAPAPAPPATVCKKSEYCCPDAKHCLTPTATSCKADKNACAAGDVCCPITEICVTPGAACVSPCADQGSYCCPDALACLTPVAPGIFCGKGCGASQVCCPLTNMCVTAGAKCTPP